MLPIVVGEIRLKMYLRTQAFVALHLRLGMRKGKATFLMISVKSTVYVSDSMGLNSVSLFVVGGTPLNAGNSSLEFMYLRVIGQVGPQFMRR